MKPKRSFAATITIYNVINARVKRERAVGLALVISNFVAAWLPWASNGLMIYGATLFIGAYFGYKKLVVPAATEVHDHPECARFLQESEE